MSENIDDRAQRYVAGYAGHIRRDDIISLLVKGLTKLTK
jgi:hypothetical protein